MENTFIKPESNLPNYYQFPEFLLHVPISHTAKIVYMLLYDRARLSMKNNWAKDGCVFVNYTLKSMAEDIQKSLTTVKSAYKELSEYGLIKRTDGGFSKPNNVFVCIPTDGRFSDLMDLHTDEKTPSVESENGTYTGKNSDHSTVGNPAPNKVNSNNYINNNNIVRGNEKKRQYGQYSNVYLTETEYIDLKNKHPYVVDKCIREMSIYLALNQYLHINHDEDYSSLIKLINGESLYDVFTRQGEL